MRISSSALSPWLGLALYTIGATAQAQPATTLFQVDFSSDAAGGCGTVGSDRIQGFLNEALVLAQVGVQLVNDYGSKAEAKRLLDVFVKGNDGSSRTAFQNSCQALINFLQNNNYPRPGGKPYLFCSDTWLIRKDLKDEAFDAGGDPFPKSDLSGMPALISDVPEYMEVRAKSAGKSPYWSLKHADYLFDYSYGRNKGYCSNKKHLAVTSDMLKPVTVTLCPESFKATRTLGGETISPLLSATIPNRPGDIPKDAQKLADLLPASSNIYHEMFHLILGNPGSYPVGWKTSEEYEIVDMGGMSAEQATKNPETYVATTVAYWYTTNRPAINGNRVEFYGFFATQG